MWDTRVFRGEGRDTNETWPRGVDGFANVYQGIVDLYQFLARRVSGMIC